MNGDVRRAVRRVADRLGPGALDVLGNQVRGADLRSFLLEVARRRAAATTPFDVVRQLRTDRLVEPGRVDARALHRTIAALLDALPSAFEVVELSPAAPFGTCSAIATVSQDKVLSTVRGTEVAADPTNLLATLAATRDPDARLAAVQRVLRTQPQGPGNQAHFTVLGAVVTGRDRGGLAFEADAVPELVGALVSAVRAVTTSALEVRFTNLRSGPIDTVLEPLATTITTVRDATVTEDPTRTAGRGYYRDWCCKVVVHTADGEVEVGDGGSTDWMARLTGDRKRRILLGGLGVDRLATLA